MSKHLWRLMIIALIVLLAACGGKSKETPAATAPDSANGSPADAQTLVTEGQSALNAGNLDEAIEKFQAAAAISPSLDAYFGLGNAYTRQNKLTEAMNAYQQALAINPNHAATLSNLGVVYYQLGKLSEAKETFSKALDVSPDDAATHYLLGATYLQMGDTNAAEKSFKKALSIDPTLPEAHFGMGMLYRMQGDTAKAISEFETFLAGPPAQDPRAKGEAEKILKELKGE
ncbi:MAG: tetratricopeptide repeat protein [Chloroflexi bacterium]|nr:tetratricopeptide repeat protein [Chloroflexota bacterium]